MNTALLTKSDILLGLACPRCLWLQKHPGHSFESVATHEQSVQQGHAFADAACVEFPLATLIPSGTLLDAAAITHSLIRASASSGLREAAFIHGGLGVRLDVVYRSRGAYIMREFKASTRLEKEHLNDCAIQLWVARNTGLDIRQVQLGLLNRHYRKGIEVGRRSRLSVVRDVTHEVEALMSSVPDWINEVREILSLPVPPARKPGHTCLFEPPAAKTEFPIERLPRTKERTRLLDAGYIDIRDVPLSELDLCQNRSVALSARRRSAFVSKRLSHALSSMPYPRSFVDFETVSFSVPLFNRSAPYEQVPVQYSCHVQDVSCKLTHTDFLWDSIEDPCRVFALQLLSAIPVNGPVFVYGAFERNVIKRLYARLPALQPELGALISRLVDLLPMVRQGYYHPDMQFSYSIKSILPTLPAGRSYKCLAGNVQSGSDIQEAWVSLAYMPNGLRRKRLRSEMLDYCELDTYAMVELVDYLSRPTVAGKYLRAA